MIFGITESVEGEVSWSRSVRVPVRVTQDRNGLFGIYDYRGETGVEDLKV